MEKLKAEEEILSDYELMAIEGGGSGSLEEYMNLRNSDIEMCVY